MSYLRRDKTKPVMNVHLRAAPMPKMSTMHRNVDTSVRYSAIARKRAPHCPRAPPRPPAPGPRVLSGPETPPPRRRPPRICPGAPRASYSYAARHCDRHEHRAPATSRTLRVLWLSQLPRGVAWGSQDTRNCPSVVFNHQNQHPSSQPQLPPTRPLRQHAGCHCSLGWVTAGCTGHPGGTLRTTRGHDDPPQPPTGTRTCKSGPIPEGRPPNAGPR